MLVGGFLAFAAAHTPVVIVPSHPTSGSSFSGTNETGMQYMPASYVKWLEMAGARVLPMSYYASDAQVDSLFAQANGLLLMGGDAKMPPSVRRLWRNAITAHAKGDPFPIWGTCLGFEWLMQLGASDDGILKKGFDSWNLSLPLNLTVQPSTSSLLQPAPTTPVPFSSPPLSIWDAFHLPVTMNNHQCGVPPGDFERNSALRSTFRVLSTNADRTGRSFVSMVEGIDLPVWATQFHPEKNIFEQGVELPSGAPYEAVSHSRAAVAVSQYFANFFVEQCRASAHRFRSASDEWAQLIYPHKTSTAKAPEFEQVYFFEH